MPDSFVRNTLRLASLAALALAASPLPALAGEPVAHLYWAVTEDAGGVWRARAGGENPELVVEAGEIPEVGLAPALGLLFYPLEDGAGQGQLWRSDLDGDDRVAIVDGIEEVSDIEIDATGGKVYWSELSGSIRRAGLDGSAPETLVTADTPRALALDLEAGHLYFDSGFQIRRANLDGSGVVTLGTSGNSTISGLEIDTDQDKLYFSMGVQTQGLTRCELDLTGCSIIIPGAMNEFELVGDALYYWQLSGLWRADLDGGNPQQLSGFVTNSFEVDPVLLQVYFAESDVIRSDLDGSNREPIVGAPGLLVHDVAVDAAAGRLYLADADFGHGAVVGTPWDGTFLRQVTAGPEGLERVRGLALDAAAGRLYWANGGSPGGIWAIDVDGTDKVEIVTGLVKAHDVALDTLAGKVYWTDNIGAGPGTGAAIRRANLDGSAPETILSDLSEGIRGLDVDPVGGALYWTDLVADEIWTADLDGTGAAALPLTATEPHDVAVDAAAGHLYWTEGIDDDDDPTGKIRRANLDGTSPVDVLTGLTARIRDLIVVYHEPIPLFADGFESGDTTAWSATTP
jgi:DNA-binding beta-propeller fold protein YncE